METLGNQSRIEERLVVAVGTQDETKLLGAPTFRANARLQTGEVVAQQVLNLLDKWNCKDKIVNMTFDTTASNTGHLSAACIKIQEKLSCYLLWSACRHHIGEVILSQIFKDLKLEASKSLDVTLFIRYGKNFELLTHYDISEPLANFAIDIDDSDCARLIEAQKQKIIQLCRQQ